MSIDQILHAIPNMDREARNRLRQNATQKLLSGNEQQKIDAKKIIDALDKVEAENRTEFKSAPASKQVEMIFGRSPLSEHERGILSAVLDNPGSTSAKLSEICGYNRGGGWHLHFGTMCKQRLASLLDRPASTDRIGDDFFTGILLHFDDNDRSFTIKPEFEDGIRALLRGKTTGERSLQK